MCESGSSALFHRTLDEELHMDILILRYHHAFTDSPHITSLQFASKRLISTLNRIPPAVSKRTTNNPQARSSIRTSTSELGWTRWRRGFIRRIMRFRARFLI
jgi:hypothetical protein